MNTIETSAQFHALTLAFAEAFKAQSVQLSNGTIAGCLANSAGYRNKTTALSGLPITLDDDIIERFAAFLSAKNKRNQLSEKSVRAIIDTHFSDRSLSLLKNFTERTIAPLIAFSEGSKEPLPARIRLNLMTGALSAEPYDPDDGEPAHSVCFPVPSDISGEALCVIFQAPVLMEALQQILDSFNHSTGSWENKALADGLLRIVRTLLQTMLSGDYMDGVVIQDQWEWADDYVADPEFSCPSGGFDRLLGDSMDLDSAVASLLEVEAANNFIRVVGDLKAAIEKKARQEGVNLDDYFQEVREREKESALRARRYANNNKQKRLDAVNGLPEPDKYKE